MGTAAEAAPLAAATALAATALAAAALTAAAQAAAASSGHKIGLSYPLPQIREESVLKKESYFEFIKDALNVTDLYPLKKVYLTLKNKIKDFICHKILFLNN